jgi:nucleotide-binding universal stress UspA family protein
MFERLLVAIDDSEQTEVTLSFAGSVAGQHGSSVRLCFVNAFQAGSRGVPLLSDDEATELVIAAIRELRTQGVSASGCVHRAQYRRVADRIGSEAGSMGADAIVIGSPRPRRLGSLLTSGVATRIARLTPLPVLMAPAPLGVPSAVQFDLGETLAAGRTRAPTRSEGQTLSE